MREESLSIRNLTLGYGKKTIVKDISFNVEKGRIVTLLGANGEGKSTLIKAVCRLKKTRGGTLSVNGKDLNRMSHRERASHISYVPQSHKPGLPISVLDMVVLGRQYCRGMFAEPSREDYKKAEEVLQRLSLTDRGEDLFTSLSGGEQRLVLIARALVQPAKYIILDEPVANLDLGNQIRVLKVIEELAREGMGVLISSHFPQHSLWLGARTVILHKGRVLAYGDADAVINGETLSQIYGTPISVARDEQGMAYCRPRFDRPSLSLEKSASDLWSGSFTEMVL